ncbi:hypothetical protein J3B02_002745, partial [Coemansia erecta]
MQPAPIQVLPFNIATRIIYYLLHEARYVQCQDTPAPSSVVVQRQRTRARPLFQLSHIWRQLLMRELCKSYIIGITNGGRSATTGYAQRPSKMKELDSGTVDYVLVSLVFRAAGVVNGNSWSVSRSSKVVDNVKQFCQFIRQMTPRLQKFSVICGRQQIGEYRMGTDILYTGIMDSLAQDVDSVTFNYENISHRLTRISLQMGFALTYIDYQWHAQTYGNLVDIVTRNALHLESLAVKDIPDFAMVLRLFLDQQKEPLFYPHLKKIYLKINDTKHTDQNLLDNQGSLSFAFPVLQHLRIDGVFPFTKDVFFRGNHQNLHTLSLYMDAELKDKFLFITELATFQSLFTLRKLSLHTPDMQSQLVTEGPTMQGLVYQLLQYMPPMLQTLELYGGLDYTALAEKICDNSDHLASIQTLVLDGPRCTSPSMRDIIRIIKHLPSLGDLHSGISQTGFSSYMMDQSLLPSFCIKTYSPMPRNFRCWT